MHKREVSSIRWQADYPHLCHLDWALGGVCLSGKAIPLEMSKVLRNQTLSLATIYHLSVFIELESQEERNQEAGNRGFSLG